VPTRLGSTSERPRLLLVEPERRRQLTLSALVSPLADVDIVDSFVDARARLEETLYDLVVADLRLGAYNGIHLAYTVRLAGAMTHVLVHAGARDAVAARDIQRAGALFERTERLVVALPAYVGAVLPLEDRRDPERFDRRRSNRGGRRAWDQRPVDAEG
jgi:CheY-like chemotaxis protein